MVVHLKYRLVARNVFSPSVSGAYVGFSQYPSHGPERFVLINDRTGKRIVMPRGCDGGVVGVVSVALNCGDLKGTAFSPFYGLYNIQKRKLRRFPCNAGCQQDYDNQNLVAVGERMVSKPSCNLTNHAATACTTPADRQRTSTTTSAPALRASRPWANPR